MVDVSVSIIMPTYNCGAYIKESIDSVLAQTFQNWELLIIDDCSTDNTEEIVKRYLWEKRVLYYKLEKNSGPATARNIGLEKAKGTYIAFLDSDDLWTEDKLEKQIAFMQKHNAKLSCTAYEKMTEQGELLGVIVEPYEKADYDKVLFSGNSLGNSTVMYEREPFSDLRVPMIKKRNDFALWLQILKKEQYAYGILEPLMFYRVRKASVSSNKTTLFAYHWDLYRHIEGLSLPKASFAMVSCVAVKALQKVKEHLFDISADEDETIKI